MLTAGRQDSGGGQKSTKCVKIPSDGMLTPIGGSGYHGRCGRSGACLSRPGSARPGVAQAGTGRPGQSGLIALAPVATRRRRDHVLGFRGKTNNMPHTKMNELLSAQRIFEGIPRATIDKLADSGRFLSLSKGDVVIQEGDKVTSIYCLLKGEVDILLPDDLEEYDDLTLVNMLVDGECIGEYSFVDEQPASATVRANTDIELLELSHDVLRGAFEADCDLRAQLYKNLLESLVERLRNTNIYIDYLRRSKAEH
jgi:CRP/FNR family transcriptional regulator, cyclic AMP receptor protein